MLCLGVCSGTGAAAHTTGLTVRHTAGTVVARRAARWIFDRPNGPRHARVLPPTVHKHAIVARPGRMRVRNDTAVVAWLLGLAGFPVGPKPKAMLSALQRTLAL